MTKKGPNPNAKPPACVQLHKGGKVYDSVVVQAYRGIVELSVPAILGAPTYTFRLSTGDPERVLLEQQWRIDADDLRALRSWYHESTGKYIKPRPSKLKEAKWGEPVREPSKGAKVDPRQEKLF